MSQTVVLKTWATAQDVEDGMNEEHPILWRRMIALMTERDLSGKTVLDFGCNQGGLLRALYHSHGYERALGVDIASESVAKAQALAGPIPARYEVRTDLAGLEGQFDVALSHEVIYLLPNLEAHAAAIHACLKPGGVYYAAIGGHADNPQWPRWRELLAPLSNLPIQDHSLDDYARAFEAAGFRVSAQRFRVDEFIPINPNSEFMGGVAAALEYYDSSKVLFRLQKPS